MSKVRVETSERLTCNVASNVTEDVICRELPILSQGDARQQHGHCTVQNITPA